MDAEKERVFDLLSAEIAGHNFTNVHAHGITSPSWKCNSPEHAQEVGYHEARNCWKAKLNQWATAQKRCGDLFDFYLDDGPVGQHFEVSCNLELDHAGRPHHGKFMDVRFGEYAAWSRSFYWHNQGRNVDRGVRCPTCEGTNIMQNVHQGVAEYRCLVKYCSTIWGG